MARASLGTVSSVMGCTYCKTTPSLNEISKTSRPLIVEMKGSIEEDHEIDLITSRIADLKASIHDKDVEEFLFSMLGDGFQLRKDVIREVLGNQILYACLCLFKLLFPSNIILLWPYSSCDCLYFYFMNANYLCSCYYILFQ